MEDSTPDNKHSAANVEASAVEEAALLERLVNITFTYYENTEVKGFTYLSMMPALAEGRLAFLPVVKLDDQRLVVQYFRTEGLFDFTLSFRSAEQLYALEPLPDYVDDMTALRAVEDAVLQATQNLDEGPYDAGESECTNAADVG